VIHGTVVSLRPVAEDDLDELHRGLIDIEARGPWYPMSRTSLTKLRAEFEAAGFWSDDEGVFVMVDARERIVGNVSWERLNGDVPDVELGYRVFDRAGWGAGVATEALDLLAGWLFDSQSMNRLRLTIHVDNAASQRVAEKCGFTMEGTSREAWYHKGQWHDIAVYTLTRAESDARRKNPELTRINRA
jgi:[ribosomal protein S5]-alanine N-acetyltransferase